MTRLSILATILSLTIISSCSRKDITKPEPKPYTLTVPANFPELPGNSRNPLTEEGVILGSRLFFDEQLSGNNRISCATCHRPELSFTDGLAFSNLGVSGTMLHRHTPALINMAWVNDGLFWDGGATNLESQALGPITAHNEMAQDLYELVRELQADGLYRKQFQAAFNDTVSTDNIVKALAQFQRTLVSANSRYDKYVRNENGGWLTGEEQKGLTLVQRKCQGCHSGSLFTDNKYHNNGIDGSFSGEPFEGIYLGRFRITYDQGDIGKFKTPTLRNIMLTPPYMHDGRFQTIEEVLDHYAHNVKPSATLDPLLRQNTGEMPGVYLTQREKQQILAFLQTLTDSSFILKKYLPAP